MSDNSAMTPGGGAGSSPAALREHVTLPTRIHAAVTRLADGRRTAP